jgi:hypothetical protein
MVLRCIVVVTKDMQRIGNEAKTSQTRWNPRCHSRQKGGGTIEPAELVESMKKSIAAQDVIWPFHSY